MNEDTGHWESVAGLFNQALQVAPEVRQKFLARACGENTALLKEVRSLLRHDLRTTVDFLRAAPSGPQVDWAKLTGLRVDRFVLIEEIGRGGGGIVFKARQRVGVDRLVALKILFEEPLDRRRFVREVQILAKLHHPNIATLFDCGFTASGLPYLAMELVNGDPITVFRASRKMDTEAVLRLFLQVCAALQFTHKHNVAHLDIKPDNVLVTRDGVVKLLDFGVAKMLDSSGAPATPGDGRESTRFTPSFATPEQLAGRGVSTVSDIYASGLLLYELLTGVNPQEGVLRESPGLLQDLSRDLDFPAPSRMLLGELSRSSNGGHRVGTGSLWRWRSALGSDQDLDAIVLKAIQRMPDNRYQSVAELSADINRRLQGHPVLSRLDSLGRTRWGRLSHLRVYRLSRFVRRNWGVVVALTVLIGLLSFITVQSRLQYSAIARERDTVRRVEDFLVNIFRVPDPKEGRGNTVTAREILETGTAIIGDDLSDEPAIQARLREVIGRVYRNLGLLTEAKRELELSLEIRSRIPGISPLEIASSRNNLGVVQGMLGDLPEARNNLRQALDIALESGADPVFAANVMNHLASALLEIGDRDEARRLLAQMIDRYESFGDSQDLAGGYNALAVLAYQDGNFEEAERLFRLTLRNRRLVGRDTPEVAGALNNLGDLLRTRGKNEEAITLLQEAVRIRRELLGADHLDLATSLSNLGICLFSRGDWEGALALFREALGIYLQRLGSEDYRVNLIRGNIAAAMGRMGRYREAEKILREILVLHEKELGEQHAMVGRDYANLATLVMLQDRCREALPLFERSLAIRRQNFAEDHAQISHSLNGLAQALHLCGRANEADELFRQALAIRKDAFGEDHPEYRRTEVLYAENLTTLKRAEEAESILAAASASLSKSLGDKHPDTALARNAQGEALMRLNRLDQAEPLILESTPLLEEAFSGESYRRRIVSERAQELKERLASKGRAAVPH